MNKKQHSTEDSPQKEGPSSFQYSQTKQGPKGATTEVSFEEAHPLPFPPHLVCGVTHNKRQFCFACSGHDKQEVENSTERLPTTELVSITTPANRVGTGKRTARTGALSIQNKESGSRVNPPNAVVKGENA